MTKRTKRGKFTADRLQTAAAVVGVTSNADLAKRLGMGTSTTHNYWKGLRPNISAVELLFVADKLDVNPRYLLGLSDELTAPKALDPDESAVLELYRGLRKLPDQRWCNDWIADGNKIIERLGEPSPGNPFGKK